VYYALGNTFDIWLIMNDVVPISAAGNGTTYGWYAQFQAKVSKGDKIKFNKNNYTTVNIYFVPHK